MTENMVISYHNNKSFYNRTGHYKLRKVCKLLDESYQHNVKSTLLPAGMSAINTVFQNIFIDNQWKNINIIFGNELYSETIDLIFYYHEKYKNIKIESFNVTDSQSFIESLQEKSNKVNILYIESCSNPNGYIFDFELIPKLRLLSKKLYVIVDNTWITSVIFNPFKYDVDFTVLSLTKYYSGGGCIAGAIISNHQLMDNIIYFIDITGLHVSPLYCDILLENIPKMKDHIIYTYNITHQLAKFLLNQTKVYNVNYVLLSNHISHDNAIKFFNNIGPSVLTFTLKDNLENITNLMKRLNKIKLETSFGSATTRFDYPDEIVSTNELQNGIRCRLAVGYLDTYENIHNELIRMLQLL